MSAIELRLDRLERQNRRLRFGLLALGLIMAGGVLAGLANAMMDIQPTIQARGFELFDAQNRKRAQLKMVSGQPSLVLFRSNRLPGAVLSLDGNNPHLVLNGRDTLPRAFLSVETNTPLLGMANEQLQTAIQMSVFQGDGEIEVIRNSHEGGSVKLGPSVYLAGGAVSIYASDPTQRVVDLFADVQEGYLTLWRNGSGAPTSTFQAP